MATLSRKQREIAERAELILDVARGMLLERGYLGLTMDRIAAATEYSKGTIYQHFANKEDLVAALAHQTAEKRTALFERAATFRGRPRERMLAIGVAAQLFTEQNPDHAISEQIISASSIRAKTGEDRRKALESCEFRCMSVASGVVRDGIAQGDLELPGGVSPEDVIYGLWTLHLGTVMLLHSDKPHGSLGFGEPFAVLLRNSMAMLDGYGWRPLSAEMNIPEILERIRTEIFPA